MKQAGETRNSKSKPGRSDKVRVAVVALVACIILYSTWELQEASVSNEEELEAKHIFLREARPPVAELSSGAISNRSNTSISSTTNNISSSSSLSPPAPARKKALKTDAYRVNSCFAYPHLDFSGIAVKFGYEHKKTNAGECCDACHAFKPVGKDALDCNVWVWCGEKELCKEHYQECWLKHLAHLQVTSPLGSGPTIGWTVGTKDTVDLRNSFAGIVLRNNSVTYDEARVNADAYLVEKFQREPKPKPFHTITSFQGRGVEWSMRIHYYHFRKMRTLCRKQMGDKCEMGGFTRLLHSGSPDQLCDEIPTIVVDALPESVVAHRAYVVLNRPYAFVEWIKIVNVPEKYIFMSEPDHILLHPLPNFMRGDVPAAFPFFYVVATDPKSIPHVKRHTGIETVNQLEEVYPMGNSPVWMTLDDIKKIMPVWHNITVNVYKDKAAAVEWGWVQEMYGFAMAAWLVGIKEVDLLPHIMAQPPYDTAYEERAGKPFYIIHYTYGLDYNRSGTMLPDKIGEWHFDKRALRRPISRNMSEPFPKVNNSLVRQLVRAFNEATDAFPCWDKYSEAGDMPKTCDEAPKGYLATAEAKLD